VAGQYGGSAFQSGEPPNNRFNTRFDYDILNPHLPQLTNVSFISSPIQKSGKKKTRSSANTTQPPVLILCWYLGIVGH